MLGKSEGRRRRGQQRMRWVDGIIDSKDVSLSKLQGSLACCSPWGHRVGHNCGTELNWIKILITFTLVELIKLTPKCMYIEEQKAKNNQDIRMSRSNLSQQIPKIAMKIVGFGTKRTKRSVKWHKKPDAAKETINKKKRQPNKWEKIFANHTYNKKLISKIYFKNSYNSIKKIWSKNGQRTWIDIFPKKIFKWPTGTLKGTQHH